MRDQSMIRFHALLVVPVLWLTSFATWATIAGHLWTGRIALVLLVVTLLAGSRE